LRDKIKIALRELYGNEKTNLDRVFIEVITEGLLISEWFEKEKWATFNQVVFELNSIGEIKKAQELQYYLTDNNDPIIACLTIIERMGNKNNELARLYEKITTFNVNFYE